VDRIIDKRSAAIKRIAGRLMPRVKQAEVRRLQSIRSGKGAKSIRAFMSGNINAV
jgi:Holliday junction resolvasome RuvABC ATP-dependent DNA helicase subunit